MDVGDGTLKSMLRRAERHLIVIALAETRHNIAQAAINLGLHRSSLQRKIKKLDIFVRK